MSYRRATKRPNRRWKRREEQGAAMGARSELLRARHFERSLTPQVSDSGPRRAAVPVPTISSSACVSQRGEPEKNAGRRPCFQACDLVSFPACGRSHGDFCMFPFRFSPPIFLFLISIIPSIWILELHYQQDKAGDPQCKKLDSWENVKQVITLNETTGDNLTYQNYLENINQALCSNEWILALHQILLVLLIVGKWLLPLGGGVTRDELSQLLLIFVGTAADILEFTSETLSDVKENSPQLVYIILAVWTWSMLQFPLHLAVVNSKSDEREVRQASLLTKHSTDIWGIVEALFIQDGPFLTVRLTVMTYFDVFHQMLVFFAIKNFLVVILNVYRLAVICQDFRLSRSGSGLGGATP